jgi:hypothetical protein
MSALIKHERAVTTALAIVAVGMSAGASGNAGKSPRAAVQKTGSARRTSTRSTSMATQVVKRTARVRSAHPASGGFVEHDTAAQLAALI